MLTLYGVISKELVISNKALEGAFFSSAPYYLG